MHVSLQNANALAFWAKRQLTKHWTKFQKLKKKEGHGNWLDWLAENFEASRYTAARYMQIASNSARVRNLGDISLRKALEAISKEDKDDKKKTAMACVRVGYSKVQRAELFIPSRLRAGGLVANIPLCLQL